jgi:hypothetical protein
MALRLNLYHEVLLAKKKEQYDPLKLSIFGIIIVAVGLVGYYFFELSKKSSATAAAATAQAEYDRLVPEAAAAKLREDALNKEIAMADALSKRIEGRFHWAPVLGHVATVVPRNVQLYKLSGEVAGQSPQRCQLTLEGSAAGTEPRKAAEELRTALVERMGVGFQNVTAVFKSLDDSTERAELDGIQYPTSVFTIGVTFETRDAVAPVAGGIAQKN